MSSSSQVTRAGEVAASPDSSFPGRLGATRSLEEFAAGALDWPAVRAWLDRHAHSSLGRRALRELAPRSDDRCAAALARVREGLDARVRAPIPSLEDPIAILSAARAAHRSLVGLELHALARFLAAFEALCDWTGAHAEALPSWAALAATRPDLGALRERLTASVDAHGRVVDHASPKLWKLRSESAEIDAELERSVRELAGRASLKGALAEGHAGKVHLRGGRRVLAVRARMTHRVPGIAHDRSASGETLFVEPAAAVAAGNRLATLRADASREESRVLAELSRAALASEREVLAGAEIWAELELASMACDWAAVAGARVPDTAGGSGASAELVLRGARHPLLALRESEDAGFRAVAIDLRLGGDFDLLVLTGPNTGGKTAALKTAGLAVLFARLGLPFPCAAGSAVPLYDGIAADIGDEQEIQHNLSTFSSHLARIRAALRRAGPRTLVLLDELGSGTDPEEGAALGEAVLEALLERGAPALATTHIARLKELAYRRARVENACLEFDLATLAPCYRVRIGTAGESRALAIARRLGLPAEIVARAEQCLVRRAGELEGLMAAVDRSRVAAEDARVRLDAELRSAADERDALTRERETLQRARGVVGAEADRELSQRVARARAWIERARALLPQLAPAQRKQLDEIAAGLEAELAAASLSERRTAFLAKLGKGDLVWVPRFKKRLQVLKLERARGEAVLRLGQREVRLALDELSPFEGV